MQRSHWHTKLYEIAGGTNQIMRNIITRQLAK